MKLTWSSWWTPSTSFRTTHSFSSSTDSTIKFFIRCTITIIKLANWSSSQIWAIVYKIIFSNLSCENSLNHKDYSTELKIDAGNSIGVNIDSGGTSSQIICSQITVFTSWEASLNTSVQFPWIVVDNKETFSSVEINLILVFQTMKSDHKKIGDVSSRLTTKFEYR